MKSIYTSKTFWANVLAAILAVLALPEVNLLSPTLLPYIGMLTAVGNVLLRRITEEPVAFISPRSPAAKTRGIGVLLLLVSVGIAVGCSALARPYNLSPEATLAFRNTQVIKGLDLLRDTAVDANAQTPPLISTETTRKVIEFHVAALKIIDATSDGWFTVLRQSLKELADVIPDNERGLLGPYLGLMRSILQERTT